LYCINTDIIADFAGSVSFTASSKVTLTDVNNYIASESNYIDSAISSKYLTPVIIGNSPLAFDLLKRICIFRVSDRIRNILEIKTGEKKTDQDTKGQSRMPSDDLKKIIDGKLRLIDATLATSDDGLTFGIRQESYAPFDLNKQQW
jgi:hypothetical protein